MKQLVWLGLAALGLCAPAAAQESWSFSETYGACVASAGVDVSAISSCAEAELTNAETALAEVYSASLEAESGDALVFLRYGQAAWDKFRTSNCAYYAVAVDVAGKSTCMLQMTAARIDELTEGAAFYDPLGD